MGLNCLFCGERVIPTGKEPMIPMKEGNKIVFNPVHRECYNKRKSEGQD